MNVVYIHIKGVLDISVCYSILCVVYALYLDGPGEWRAKVENTKIQYIYHIIKKNYNKWCNYFAIFRS